MRSLLATLPRLTCLLLSMFVISTASPVLAQTTDVSQIRVGMETTNTSTATANAYYPTSLTSTREFWGPDPALNRPVELKELARALRYNVDLIYEYVHDNVRPVFMYGLQKGALGAMIDQSGTSFDQAQLMVELLRESGYSARYKVGTLQLNATQVAAWIGTSNAAAVQKTFRDGGIPVNFNAVGPTYTIGHVWVEVTIPGSACNTTCWFDPSYKTHTFKSALNLEALMGWTGTEFSTTDSAGFFGQAWSGLQQQTTAMDPVWVGSVNTANIQAKLQSYASTLLTNLRSPAHSAKDIDDVIGGQEIMRAGSAPIRNAGTLPGFASAVLRTWDCTGNTTCGIPDPYRTKLTVTMLDTYQTPFVVMNKPFFVDEIYGRRLFLDIPLNIKAPDTGGPGTLEPFCIKMTLDGTPIPTTAQNPTVLGCGQTPNYTDHNPLGRIYGVRLEVDHPYAAASGGYMDQTVANGTATIKEASFLTPVVIVHGWGDVSPALSSRLASEQSADRLMPVVDPYPGPGGTYEPGEKKGDSSMDHTMVKLGALYLAQYSRMAELQQRIGLSSHVQHHAVGLVYSVADPANGWDLAGINNPTTNNEWYIRDRAVRINMDGAISVNSNTDLAADRQKVIQSTLAAASTLEGSIFEQMLDAPFSGSTGARFQWGSANIAGLKYFLYRPTSPAPSGGLGSDFTTLGCANAIALMQNGLPLYVNATKGFWAIVANEKCLGPGNKFGTADGSTGFAYPVRSIQRGQSFFAFAPDGSSVAHVVGYTDSYGAPGGFYKGGGAPAAPSYAREFDAAGAASLLKDKFEDRSRLHGVDLRTGELTYSAPADLTLGEGGFPYELSFQRTFKAGGSTSPGLPDGWAHNLDVGAAFSGDGLAKMGTDSAPAAAETIAAIYVAQRLYSVAPTLNASTTPANLQTHLKRWVLAPFVMGWWGTKLSYNVVTINAGHDARQFVRFADGQFYPPRNGVGTLVQNGQRMLHIDGPLTGQYGETAYDHWDYSPVSFTYTSPERDVQTFSYFEVENPYGTLQFNTEHSTGRTHGWKLSTWSFPQGVTLTYTYTTTQIGQDAISRRLASISNNLGRTLTLGYSASPDADFSLLTSVSDGQGRTATFSQPGASWDGRLLTQSTSPESANGAEITRYEYIGDGQNAGLQSPNARPVTAPRLWRLFAPTDSVNPKLQVDYDASWRVKEFRDAIAVQTPDLRAPWRFYITGTNRGEREDPLDTVADAHEYRVYYDWRGRAIEITDEESRKYLQTFDNHDRVAERTSPEGNRVQFLYDDLTHQVKQVTQLPKSTTYYSAALANLVVSATYDPVCAKLKTVTDARGKVTTWNYNSTGVTPACTLASIQQPQVPDPQNANALTTPTTSFLYNGFGQITQLTDPTGRVVSFEYDPTSRYRLRRRVDPTGLNLVTEYGHNAYGDISFVRDPLLNQVNYTFDKMRRLTRVDAPLGSTTTVLHDRDGDVTEVRRATNLAQTQWQVWLKSYTATKKLSQETSPTGAVTSTFYDALDRVAYVQDPDGRKVKTDYFRDGKTKRVTKAFQSPTMPEIVYATYTLTPNGQIDTVTDANGNVTNLDYDGHDRAVRTFFPDPATGLPCSPALPHSTAAPTCTANQTWEQLTLDANGNVTAKRNRSGVSLTMVYDDLNRETSRVIPDNAAVLGNFARTLTSTYDLAGRKWDLTADSQTIGHRYDAAGRVDFVTDSFIGGTVDSTFDVAGNRTRLTYPGGYFVSYTYDALNQLDVVTDSGGVQLANYDYDILSRKDLLTLGNAGVPATVDWGYEADDDLLTLANNGPGALTFTFGRNLSGQITSIGASDGAFLSRPGVTKTETVTSNRLNQVSSVVGPGGTSTYTHDANGNLTSDGSFIFAYDEENRLRTVALPATPGTPFASYEYDPLGRRRAKVVNGVATRYVSDGAEEIEERNGSNGLLRQFVNGAGIDEHIAILDATLCPGGGRCFLRTNWQGSTTHLVAQSGALVETYHYGPYGERVDWTPQDGDSGNPYRYTGRRYDAETGLYYYRARYYSPKLGRFLQADPTGVKDDLNLYAYVGNDPANKTDPTGEFGVVGFFIGAALDTVVQVGTNMASGQDFGEALSDVDVGDVLVAGAVSAVIPGIGNALKTGATSVRAAANSVKATRALAQQSARTANRAAKIEQRTAAHAEKIMGAGREAADAAGTAIVHQIVKQTVQTVTPPVTPAAGSNFPGASAPTPPPPPPCTSNQNSSGGCPR